MSREEGHWARNCGKIRNIDKDVSNCNGIAYMARECPKKRENMRIGNVKREYWERDCKMEEREKKTRTRWGNKGK